MGSGFCTNAGQQILGQHVTVHHQRYVTSDFRVAGQFHKARQLTLANFRQCQLEHKNGAVKVQVSNQLRMQRADQADLLLAIEDASRLARVQCRVVNRCKTESNTGCALRQDGFNISFDVKEVDLLGTIGPTFWLSAAGHDTRQHDFLQQAIPARDKALASFKRRTRLC